MMKLGVCYNVFDGCEHLQESINGIREHVDFIGLVVQYISNHGTYISAFDNEDIKSVLPLVDEVVLYNPDLSFIPHENELAKRNAGLQLAIEKGCTHFMTIDCDEIYIPSQFKAAKEKAVYFDSTFCKMQTYYHDINHVIDPPEEYYVPFIYKIDNRKFNKFSKYPVVCDPTRKMEIRDYYLFERSEIEMHHYSYIRRDMKRKLENSSAKRNFQQIDNCINHYNNWVDGMDGMSGSGSMFKLKKV